MPSIDLSPLEDALNQLDNGLREADQDRSSMLLRDGVIKRFEYSHELAVKFIRRTLEMIFGDPVDQMPYNDMLRTAAERGLLATVEPWFAYRVARNKTSHTYDAGIAAEVFSFAAPFLLDARALLRQLHVASNQPRA